MANIEVGNETLLAPLEARSRDVARVLKLMSNQKRLLILCKLAAAGETPVSEISKAVNLSQSAVSQHLAKMREENLIRYRRESQTLFYSIADSQVEELLAALKDIYCPELSI